MARKHFGLLQCDAIQGQTSRGRFCTSPTSRSTVPRPFPALTRAMSFGRIRPPPSIAASANLTKPDRASQAPRRENRAPSRSRALSRAGQSLQYVGETGSTRTSPAISCGILQAYARASSPPNECPTSTYGDGTPARDKRERRSATASEMEGTDLAPSLHPSPARS
jgi:hypothetical protein